jgi:hypothetical protein
LAAKQPLDSDLTTLAGLTATTDNFIVSASSAWASRTPAQAKTSLALVKGDVGLGNVDNVADTGKPVSTAQQTALNLKANLASPTFTGTVAGVTATHVGLGNCNNTSDASKPVSTATQTALDGKAATTHDILTAHNGFPGGSTNFLRADGTFAAPGGGGLSDGDKGDITVSGSGATWTIDAAAVTNAQLATMTTKTYKGRTAGTTGAPEDVAVATLKTDLALNNCDNTTDANKPVSSATTTQLNLKAPIAGPSFTGNVTLAEGAFIVIGATTGADIGGASSKIGFFGVTPVVRPGALTQTYSTTSTTIANITSLAAPAGGTGTAAGGYSTAANRDLMITSQNAMRTDIANIKNNLNSVIDQLQALGLLQ